MIEVVSILNLIIFLFSLGIYIKTKKKGICLYDGFYVGIVIYTIGSYILASINLNDDSMFLLSISSILLFVCGICFILNRVTLNDGLNTENIGNLASKNNIFANLSFLFLITVNVSFVYLVYIKIINGHFSGVFALLDIRKTISSGEAGYFAPGLIKQIRDIFGPAYLVWLMLFYNHKNSKILFFVTFLVILASMIFGGQRMPVLVLFLSIGLAYLFKARLQNKKLSKITIISVAAILLTILSSINILLGRVEQEDGQGVMIISLFFGLLTRIFTVVPEENLRILPFLESVKLGTFELWLSDLAILLPGKQESMSSAMHSYLGGSAQGNSVLGTPLDIFINSSYIGLIIVPILVLLTLKSMQKILLFNKNPFAISIIIVSFCYLPFCYSLYIFLLNGGLILLVYMIYNFLTKKRIKIK